MIWNETIKGKFVELRYARLEDAEAILSIRQDPELTKYLPRLDISVEQQKQWLAEQHSREGDYYFVVWRKELPIGTIRVYNVCGTEGETGSIAIKGKAYENLEAKLLCDTFAYETLGLKKTHNIVRSDNKAIIKFVEKFGVEWTEEYTDEKGVKWLRGENTAERSKFYCDCVADALYNFEEENVEHDVVEVCKTEEKVKSILEKEINGIDFDKVDSMIDDGIIDSLGLITVVSLIEEAFCCKIPFNKVNARNFNSTKRIANMILTLNDNTSKDYKNEVIGKKLVFEPLVLDIEDTKLTVVERIFNNALKLPDTTAIIANEKETSYQELAGMILSISSFMKEKGIKSKDTVVVQAIHEDTCIACYYAVHLLGAILVPVEKTATIKRISEIANETCSKLIISLEQGEGSIKWLKYEQLRKILGNKTFSRDIEIVFPNIDQPCEMIFTTGTTGKSKGVLMSHRHISWYAYSIAKNLEMKKNNRFLLTTPLNHAGGLRRTHLSLANGCCMVYIDGMSDLEKYFDYINKYGVTSLYLPPVAIRILLTKTGNELGRYKNCIDFVYSSSSSLPIGDCKELAKLLPLSRLYNAYEASETPGVSMYDYNSEAVVDNNCLGNANDGVEIKILDENGVFFDENNKKGQICIKSKMNMKEYFGEKELTCSVLKDGWFISNDLGYIDNKGRLYFCGRIGDVINIGGYKIAPTDVEETALLSGIISECICIEDYDEYQVPYLKLLVVAKDGFDSRKLISLLCEKLEPYKIPRKVEIVESINKTFNGKINRKYYRSKE